MAKKRHGDYSLSETMADVKLNIEGANAEPTSEVELAPIVPEPIAPLVTVATPTAVTETKVEELPVESPTLLQSETSQAESDENKKSPVPTERKKKGKKAETPVMDNDVAGKGNLRNVELDDETLWRLDQVKDKQNRSRMEGDPLVTQKTIIRTALIEWLDKYYPGTREAYHIVNNLD